MLLSADGAEEHGTGHGWPAGRRALPDRLELGEADRGHTPPVIALAKKLAELAPGDLNHVFFVNSGSEANETAIKLARYFWFLQGRGSKTAVLAHDRGYHGVSGATTYVTGLAPYHVGFGSRPGWDPSFSEPV